MDKCKTSFTEGFHKTQVKVLMSLPTSRQQQLLQINQNLSTAYLKTHLPRDFKDKTTVCEEHKNKTVVLQKRAKDLVVHQ